MHKALGIIFALLCLATSSVSSSIMGVGLWFWIIIATGIAVAASQFFPKIRPAGVTLANLLSVISVCAVLLGLVAATIGGSFSMGGTEALLLFLFAMVALFGFILSFTYGRAARTKFEIDA